MFGNKIVGTARTQMKSSLFGDFLAMKDWVLKNEIGVVVKLVGEILNSFGCIPKAETNLQHDWLKWRFSLTLFVCFSVNSFLVSCIHFLTFFVFDFAAHVAIKETELNQRLWGRYNLRVFHTHNFSFLLSRCHFRLKKYIYFIEVPLILCPWQDVEGQRWNWTSCLISCPPLASVCNPLCTCVLYLYDS